MKIEEVAMRIGTSVQTVNKWYKFKRDNPDNELVQDLPDYEMLVTPAGRVRNWTEEDVWKLIEFKARIKIGRTGKMGKYGGKGTNGKKKIGRKQTDT